MLAEILKNENRHFDCLAIIENITTPVGHSKLGLPPAFIVFCLCKQFLFCPLSSISTLLGSKNSY